MAWRLPANPETTVLTGTRIDGARAGVGVVANVIDGDSRCEVVA